MNETNKKKQQQQHLLTITHKHNELLANAFIILFLFLFSFTFSFFLYINFFSLNLLFVFILCTFSLSACNLIGVRYYFFFLCLIVPFHFAQNRILFYFNLNRLKCIDIAELCPMSVHCFCGDLQTQKKTRGGTTIESTTTLHLNLCFDSQFLLLRANIW